MRNGFPDRLASLPPLYCAEFACYRVPLFPLSIPNQRGGDYDTTAKSLYFAGEQADKREDQDNTGGNAQPFPFHSITLFIHRYADYYHEFLNITTTVIIRHNR